MGEFKTPGDIDPFCALVQALACTAHLATTAQRSRLEQHVPSVDVSGGRFDVFVIQILAAEPRRARYQPSLRRAALEIIEALPRQAELDGHIRHIALLEATRADGRVQLRRAQLASD